MSPHTDAGALLEAVTDELLAHGEFSSGANNRSNARIAAEVVINMVRQAASHGSATVETGPVTVNEYEDAVAAAQAVTDCGAIRDAIVPFVTMAAAMYVSGHCGGASPEDWPSKWSISLTGGIDGHVPQQFGGMLTVADFRRLQELASALPSADREAGK